ncbi:MAG: GyrI-like domain-containing protein [Winogradskyella sp.]|uniref:GyrI-like domain-containing protein n=1 Tax=Winogradskyella sp. TaxID=1883156 RepID=UPI0017C03815|nr:GyrI-like domain-containing protein [Winogradskyella sp.]MBT8245036.1 GyrI-like domain-containing protein [Winogradskyella sp.]NNK22122.1 GyrI-like domain-containing protein [Winogradskyella sp.]
MEYKIVELGSIKIVGVKAEVSFTNNGQITRQIARKFMPRLSEIDERADDFTISLQQYDTFDFEKFNPHQTFEKWIGVMVNNFNNIPEGLDTLTISKGKYVVINFKGSVQQFIELWRELHSTWLASKNFELDNRPHFEKLPPSYNPMQVENEEEIWIPIR